jgi:hypothetical protein
MTSAIVEQAATGTKDSIEGLAKTGNAAMAGFLELTKAYQALAQKNAEKLLASVQALSAVKSPAEFFELQQKLIKEGVEAAVSDSSNIAKLTTSIFSATFEPVKQQVEALQKSTRK